MAKKKSEELHDDVEIIIDNAKETAEGVKEDMGEKLAEVKADAQTAIADVQEAVAERLKVEETPVENIAEKVEELKESAKETMSDAGAKIAGATESVVDELTHLGRQVAETLKKAWNSPERQNLEGEVRAGMRSFVSEVDKVVREVRQTVTKEGSTLKHDLTEEPVAAKEEPVASKTDSRLKVDLDLEDLTKKARSGFVFGLRWLSEEMGKLADQFSVSDKGTKSAEPTEEVIILEEEKKS